MDNAGSVSVEHYENFPVASWLCPPALRAPITAIYWFARTADDLADEGDAPVAERIAALRAYRAELAAVHQGQAPAARWAPVFGPLQQAIRSHALPFGPLDDLLDAFLQDSGNPLHPHRASLLDYCRRSANPVGRLLLHLYGLRDPVALRQSDAVCTALQLINFWQDLSVDLPRGRCYLPQDELRQAGLDWTQLGQAREPAPQAARQLVASLCDWAGTLMREGEGLVHQLPGRTGWELRLVVQGGLRILEKVGAQQFDSFQRRPKLSSWDPALMGWRALKMRPQ